MAKVVLQTILFTRNNVSSMDVQPCYQLGGNRIQIQAPREPDLGAWQRVRIRYFGTSVFLIDMRQKTSS